MTEAMACPSFDFSGETITDEELAEEMNKSFGGKFLKPGLHEVKIKEIAFEKVNKTDPSWTDLVVTYEGTGEKTIREWLSIPTRTVKFKGRRGENVYSFKKCVQFAKALGVELMASNLQTAIPSLFAKPERLVGTPLKITVGYRQAHAKFVKKEGENQIFNLVLADGNVHKDRASGEVVTFPNQDAVEAYCKEAKIGFDSFPNVQKYDVSDTPASLGSAASAGW